MSLGTASHKTTPRILRFFFAARSNFGISQFADHAQNENQTTTNKPQRQHHNHDVPVRVFHSSDD
jgi:hypothetical protein